MVGGINIPSRNILGLDLGNKTGYSVWTFKPRVSLITWGFENFTPKDSIYDDQRWYRFYGWLRKQMQAAAYVVFEDVPSPVHVGKKAAQVYGGYRAITMALAANYCDGYSLVTPGGWKRDIIGSGRASKADSIQMASRFTNKENLLTSDEADAILIGRWGADQLLREEKAE